jgi:hypothetical protein
VNKEVQQLLDRIREQGFDVRLSKSGHYRCTSPAGLTVTISATPRDGKRARRNMIAALRRIGARL